MRVHVLAGLADDSVMCDKIFDDSRHRYTDSALHAVCACGDRDPDYATARRRGQYPTAVLYKLAESPRTVSGEPLWAFPLPCIINVCYITRQHDRPTAHPGPGAV